MKVFSLVGLFALFMSPPAGAGAKGRCDYAVVNESVLVGWFVRLVHVAACRRRSKRTLRLRSCCPPHGRRADSLLACHGRTPKSLHVEVCGLAHWVAVA